MCGVWRRLFLTLGGFVFLLGAPPSHAIVYDVNFSDGTNSVTGTITTDGNFGTFVVVGHHGMGLGDLCRCGYGNISGY